MNQSDAESRQEYTLESLRELIEQVGPLQEVVARLPVSNQEVIITRPQDVDPLLDAAENDPEQNLPYWAALWPSGIGLADAILANPERVRRTRILELGSGLGVTAIAAVQADADILCTDYFEESLTFTRYNVLRNTGRTVRTLQINWRSPERTLLELAPDGFPVILAADVLYEQRDVEPLLDLVEQILAPGGLFWLAEPRRFSAQQFLDKAVERGWLVDTEEHAGAWPELDDSGVIVRVHSMRRVY